jgi:hypothetical protein
LPNRQDDLQGAGAVMTSKDLGSGLTMALPHKVGSAAAALLL